MTDHPIKDFMDALSAGIAVGAITNMIPEISGVVTIVWLGIRIWESDTVRGWTGRTIKRDYVSTETFRKYRDGES